MKSFFFIFSSNSGKTKDQRGIYGRISDGLNEKYIARDFGHDKMHTCPYFGYTSYPETMETIELGNTEFACQARARAILWATINIFALLQIST